MPEGVYAIVEATLYLATAPKSNSANDYFKYVYPHAEPDHHVGQQYLPTALLGTYFYSPSEEGYEAQVKDRLARWRAAQEKALGIEQTETLPDISQDKINSIKHRLGRRGEDA